MCTASKRKNDCQNSFFQMLIGKESISQYASYSVFTDFQPITQRYKQKIGWKAALQSIQPLQKMQSFWSLRRALQLKLWVCHSMVVYYSALFPATSNTYGNIPSKNNIRSASASTTLTQVLHRSLIIHTANCHLRRSGERNGTQKRTKVSFCSTTMQALELLQLAKRHISEWSDVD